MSKIQINNPPVYTLTNKAIDLSMRISEAIGELKGRNYFNMDFHLRKNNRLRSIQSSLAIENNSLSLQAILDAVSEISSNKITDIFTDKITDILTDKDTDFIMLILGYIKRNGFISNSKAQSITGKSAETVKKYFSKFVKLNLLIPKGENRSRVYELNNECLK